MGHRVLACLLAGACVWSLSIWQPHADGPRPAPKAKPSPAQHTSAQDALPIRFDRDILPILSSKCFPCHGIDARKGALRLDRRELALLTRKSGDTPIVPGKSASSEVVRRIHAADDAERMPPLKGGKPLTAAEKQLLKRWIDQGAEYQQHWAFTAVQRPRPPAVKNSAWVRNDIDRFILHRLEAAGLQPSPLADRATLIRRLSLDLRGLPPSFAEVDEFVRDQSADAYEKLVDRMLASPHYGEKMASLWLDLARFGDTSGYHMDSTRQMWLWRDWVINAFNRNMPFDQFTIEQLAGDLLPGATDSNKIASGFNRNTRFNEEGGVDPEEYVIRYNIDRTNTLGQAWLGLTLGCAECHSHKYDPITHKEYYQLFAFFTGIKEPMISGPDAHGKALPPLLKAPTAEQAKELDGHRKLLARVDEALAKQITALRYVDPLMGQAIPDDAPDDLAARSQLAWEAKKKAHEKLPAAVRDILRMERDKRSDAQHQMLRGYYLRKINAATREKLETLDQDVEDLGGKIRAVEDAMPYTLISEEMPIPRAAHVLIRGDFLQKGPKVERGVPAAFGPMPKDAPVNRLGLARWLVRAEHPLTARVAVNRLWAQMFGHGIVRTLGDFGTQGDYPSHPELLDWLAAEFTSGESPASAGGGGKRPAWDIKRILRMIALSATYRQSSVFVAGAEKIDPHNRLLSRMPRFRLTAEELRDGVLASAGLLNRKIGGPSFMPYQPPDFYKNKNEDWPWTPSAGDEQYRRGLYAFWRRTALHPMFAILDAPNREECTVARPRTNTPLQALVTLNDPTFVEAARALAQQILTRGPKAHEDRLIFAFRGATGRTPAPEELNILRAQFTKQYHHCRADVNAATKLVNIGQFPRDATLDVPELAAWMSLANMLLTLDEVLMRN